MKARKYDQFLIKYKVYDWKHGKMGFVGKHNDYIIATPVALMDMFMKMIKLMSVCVDDTDPVNPYSSYMEALNFLTVKTDFQDYPYGDTGETRMFPSFELRADLGANTESGGVDIRALRLLYMMHELDLSPFQDVCMYKYKSGMYTQQIFFKDVLEFDRFSIFSSPKESPRESYRQGNFEVLFERNQTDGKFHTILILRFFGSDEGENYLGFKENQFILGLEKELVSVFYALGLYYGKKRATNGVEMRFDEIKKFRAFLRKLLSSKGIDRMVISDDERLQMKELHTRLYNIKETDLF